MARRMRRLHAVSPVLQAALLALAVLAAPGAHAARPLPPSGAAAAAAGPTATAPNFVVVLADNLDSRTSPVWEAMSRTKALLADKGVSFTNAFAPTPICCPARASLLTGKYGHNTGVLTNGGEQGGWKTFAAGGNEEHTFARHLHDAGWRTGMYGKYLNDIEEDPGHIPPGWDDWHVPVDAANQQYTGYGYTLNENGTLVGYGDQPEDYLTDVLAAKAEAFIRAGEATDEQPFLLHVTPTAPHQPLPPAPRHTDHPFADATAPHLPNFQEADLSDKPAWLQTSGDRRAQQVERHNDSDYRDRMGSLYALDELVEQVVRTLEETGELDRTYLVFTSDNGYNLGAHRLHHMMVPYEESLRIPLLVAGPGVVPGRVEGRAALLIDLAPTLLELAGLPVPDDVDGRSLVPLLRGEDPPGWRTDFVAQYAGGALGQGVEQEQVASVAGQLAGDVPAYRALRGQRWLYVEWNDPLWKPPVEERELYDLQADPYQLGNLLATPEGSERYAPLVAVLERRLEQLASCAGASCH
jgi:N-acetylglucosamine-6-sulfatase